MKIPRHRTRPIRFLELVEHEGWTVKLYGISQLGELPEPDFVDAAKGILRAHLPSPAVTDSRYGVGFVVVHQAELFHQIVLDWWERANELRHRVFKAEPERPLEFREITATGEAFCVWELGVLAFEREAWLSRVLANTEGADFVGYLGERLVEDS